MLPPSGAVPRETRPVKTSAFQAACRENVEQFCRAQRCPIPINDRVLISPTQKDFHQIFRWLISEFLDTNYTWGKPQADDILDVLKDLRYPAIGNISKTALSAPGSAAHWGTLLAMLNWLVDLAKVSYISDVMTKLTGP
jgi:kinetochore protein NDC80